MTVSREYGQVYWLRNPAKAALEIAKLQRIEAAARDVVAAHDDADMENSPIGTLAQALQEKGSQCPHVPSSWSRRHVCKCGKVMEKNSEQ